jgi:hypothetical protein
MAVGMPISYRGIEGNNDAGAINGAWIVTAFDATNNRVSFDMTFPKGTPVDPTSITSGASGWFPPHWFECYGGFSGVDVEAIFNIGRAAELLTENLHAVWNPTSQTQPVKNAQRVITTNLVAGRWHNIRGPSIMAGFPGAAIRLTQNGGSYVNAVHMGVAPYGTTTYIQQNGGWAQMSSCAIGGATSQSVNVGDGCHLQQSSNYYGAGDAGLVSNGGTSTFTTCKFSSLTNALEARNGGKLYNGSTSNTASFIKSCTTAVYWNNGGRVIMDPALIIDCTNLGRDAVGTQSYGGGWVGGVSGRATETRIVNLGAKIGGHAWRGRHDRVDVARGFGSRSGGLGCARRLDLGRLRHRCGHVIRPFCHVHAGAWLHPVARGLALRPRGLYRRRNRTARQGSCLQAALQ